MSNHYQEENKDDKVIKAFILLLDIKPDELDRDTIQKIVMSGLFKNLKDRHNEFREYCDKNKIAYIEKGRRNEHHHLSSNNNNNKKPIPLDPGLPPKPEHQDLVKIEKKNYDIIKDMIDKRKEALRTNAYQTKEDHLRLIAGQESFIMLQRPQTDQKCLITYHGWIDHIRNFMAEGCGSITARCPGIKTGLIDIKNGKLLYHKISEQQIKIAWVDIVNNMEFIIENISYFFEDMLKFKETELEQRARKKKLEIIRQKKGDLDGIEKISSD